MCAGMYTLFVAICRADVMKARPFQGGYRNFSGMVHNSWSFSSVSYAYSWTKHHIKDNQVQALDDWKSPSRCGQSRIRSKPSERRLRTTHLHTELYLRETKNNLFQTLQKNFVHMTYENWYILHFVSFLKHEYLGTLLHFRWLKTIF